MTAPDRIWAMPARQLCWTKDNTKGVEVQGYYEYARVTPDTITLPRAEVEALMEAARAVWDEACANHEKAPPRKYLAPYGGLVRLHTALTALQERMK